MCAQNLFNDFDRRRNEIKQYAKEKGVPLWKIAVDMSVNDGNFSRRLRTLSEEQFEDIRERIDRLGEEEVI